MGMGVGMDVSPPSVQPGGVSGRYQYNNAGVFGGGEIVRTSATLTTFSGTAIYSSGAGVGSVRVSGTTNGGVFTADTAGPYGGTIAGLCLGSAMMVTWSNGVDSVVTGVNDIGIARNAAGVAEFNNGSASTYRDFIARDGQINSGALTAVTLTYNNSAYVKKVLHKFSWTNAMVTALGAVLAGDLTVCSLPTNTVVTNAYVVISTAAGGTASLTVALGRTAAAYIDYIVASNAQAAANTVYGDVAGERGANLTGYDMPTYGGGPTLVKLHFIATGTNLNTVTTCTGIVYLETMILP